MTQIQVHSPEPPGARQGGSVGWEEGIPDCFRCTPLACQIQRGPNNKVLGDLCLELGVTVAPETADFPTTSHLGLISSIPSASAPTGLQAGLAVCS